MKNPKLYKTQNLKRVESRINSIKLNKGKEKRILYSEEVQWKIQSTRNFMQRSKLIYKRLEKQILEISKTQDTLSKQLYAASDLFKELQIQEETLEKKLSLGINWKAELTRIRESNISKSETDEDNENPFQNSKSQKQKGAQSAYKFGVDLFKQWSLFTSSQKLSLESEIRDLIGSTNESFGHFDSKILRDQEGINEDFIYRYKTFTAERANLVRKKPVADWKMHPHWASNEFILNSLKQGEKWPLDLVLFDKSRKFWHYRDFFRTSNHFTFFQVENLRFLLNSSFYKSFERFKNETNQNLHLITHFPE